MPGIAVVIGAGASHDCADAQIGTVNTDFRPPLVNNLFANVSSFNGILKKYPKAEALSPRIRDHIARGLGLEPILRTLASAKLEAVRRQYFQIPLYLQEVIGEVSQHYITGGATRYNTLVSDLAQSGYDHVLYITVNYDLFLERALANLYDVHFNDINDYCRGGREWAMVKLHGSVTWGRRLLNGKNINSDTPFIEIDGEPQLDQEIVILTGYQGSHRIRGEHFYYPSLAVPLGEKDLACPEDHLAAMHQRLSDCSAVLIVGFSAMDAHVVQLLAGLKNVRRLAVVNGTTVDAQAALERCATHNKCFDVIPGDVSHDMGFSRFVSTGKLAGFLSVVG